MEILTLKTFFEGISLVAAINNIKRCYLNYNTSQENAIKYLKNQQKTHNSLTFH